MGCESSRGLPELGCQKPRGHQYRPVSSASHCTKHNHSRIQQTIACSSSLLFSCLAQSIENPSGIVAAASRSARPHYSTRQADFPKRPRLVKTLLIYPASDKVEHDQDFRLPAGGRTSRAIDRQSGSQSHEQVSSGRFGQRTLRVRFIQACRPICPFPASQVTASINVWERHSLHVRRASSVSQAESWGTLY